MLVKHTPSPTEHAMSLAKSRLEELTQRVQELEEALREILRVHADDNHRPKAFYIAASILNKETIRA